MIRRQPKSTLFPYTTLFRAASRRRLDGARLQQTLEQRILPHIRRRVPLKHNRPRIEAPTLRTGTLAFGLETLDFCQVGPGPDLREVSLSYLIRQPDHLERAVAFDHARHVVVDAFAGPGEQARRGIVLVHDQVGVGLVALQGDADDHLAEGSAGDSVGAPQGLRPKQHMDAESASLAHYPVQQQRRRLDRKSTRVGTEWRS